MRLAAEEGFAQPMSDKLGLDKLGDVCGIRGMTVLAVLVLIVVSFAAGIVARTDLGERVSRWFENSLLGGMPPVSSCSRAWRRGWPRCKIPAASSQRWSASRTAGGFGYLLETLENGWVAVFLPQAPTPMSGNVMYFPTERMQPLGITMIQAMALVKHIGVGSAEALRGADLRLPGA